jgi:hypothetical protein
MMSNLIPKYMSRDELLFVLEEITTTVREYDTFGGFIEFDAMDESIPEGKDFAVVASYRIGNSRGQGGVVLIGTIPNADGNTKED